MTDTKDTNHEIRKVRELITVDTLNKYLAAGWVLLETTKVSEGENSWFKYSIGWPGALPANEPT